jgi:hypothetical protein
VWSRAGERRGNPDLAGVAMRAPDSEFFSGPEAGLRTLTSSLFTQRGAKTTPSPPPLL